VKSFDGNSKHNIDQPIVVIMTENIISASYIMQRCVSINIEIKSYDSHISGTRKFDVIMNEMQDVMWCTVRFVIDWQSRLSNLKQEIKTMIGLLAAKCIVHMLQLSCLNQSLVGSGIS